MKIFIWREEKMKQTTPLRRTYTTARQNDDDSVIISYTRVKKALIFLKKNLPKMS
jgi:hypothetical protein